MSRFLISSTLNTDNGQESLCRLIDMTDENKTKAQLIQELNRLRSRLKTQAILKKKYNRLNYELQRREKRFQSVVENINVGLYRNTTGPKGRFIDVNTACVRILGYSSKEEILKRNVSDFYLNPEERTKLSQKIKKLGFVRNEEITLKQQDGTPILCSISAVAVKDEQGTTKFFDGVIEDITESRQAEEAKRQSEAKFRNIVEASPMGMHLYELHADNKLVFIGANPAADRILQVDNSQFVGKTIEEAFPPLADSEVPRRYREAASEGISWRTDQIVYEDKQIKGAFEVYAFQTSPGRMAAVFLDTTERKRAEEALKESKERYQALFDRSLHAVFVHDFSGRFLDANKAALRMIEYKEDEMPELDFGSLLDKKQLPRALAGIKEIIETGSQKKPTVYRLKTKSGGHIWAETEATLLYKRGEPFAIQGIARDITDQKEAEEALRESEKQYRAIFESFHDVYYRTDRDGIVTLISPSVKNQAGYSPEDVVGHPVTDFYLDPDERESFNQTLKMKGFVNDYELQLLAKDGRVIEVSASSKLVFGKNGKPVGIEGLLRDITDRKQADREIQASLKEKEVLLLEIHHRVKNNMQIISSLLNLQSSKVKDTEVVGMFQESRDRIRAMALIHEKLYQSKDLAQVNLAQYIESLYLHLYHMYRVDSSAIRLNKHIEDVFLDINIAIPIGLVINELVSNALKHAFPNGSQGEICIELSCEMEGKYRLLVKDNGVGLPPGVDIENPDTLGMQLVYDLVAQIGGKIDIDSCDGAAFQVTF